MTAAKAKKRSLAKAKGLVSRLNRRIARDNRAFEKMTPAQKRVRIANDVRDQILDERIVPTPGTWIDVDMKIGKRLGRTKVTPDTELRDVFKAVKQCDACAIGGMFLCAVELADRLKVKELAGYEEDEDAGDYLPRGTNVSADEPDVALGFLERFFDREQLNLIESAFEQGEGSSGMAGGEFFANDVDDAADRMRLIMENIIVHKGLFDPEAKPKAVYTTPGFKA